MMLHVGDLAPLALAPGWHVMQRIGSIIYEARLERQRDGRVVVAETRTREVVPGPYSDMKAR